MELLAIFGQIWPKTLYYMYSTGSLARFRATLKIRKNLILVGIFQIFQFLFILAIYLTLIARSSHNFAGTFRLEIHVCVCTCVHVQYMYNDFY